MESNNTEETKAFNGCACACQTAHIIQPGIGRHWLVVGAGLEHYFDAELLQGLMNSSGAMNDSAVESSEHLSRVTRALGGALAPGQAGVKVKGVLFMHVSDRPSKGYIGAVEGAIRGCARAPGVPGGWRAKGDGGIV